MPQITHLLRLAFAFPAPGHKSPVILLQDDRDVILGRIPTAEPFPCLPLPDDSVHAVDARDVLEHVHDEQAWLAELARVLVPGGDLTARVPLENLLAWADGLNVYRYLGDTLRIGGVPTETLPTGWHRHYAPGDLPAILELAGFEVTSTATRGLPVEEAPHLLGLLGSNLFPNARAAQRRLFRIRAPFRDRPRLPMPRAIAATITVQARLVRPAFRPEPDVEDERRPDEETDEGLE